MMHFSFVINHLVSVGVIRSHLERTQSDVD